MKSYLPFIVMIGVSIAAYYAFKALGFGMFPVALLTFLALVVAYSFGAGANSKH